MDIIIIVIIIYYIPSTHFEKPWLSVDETWLKKDLVPNYYMQLILKYGLLEIMALGVS